MKLSKQYIAGFIDGEGYLSILKLKRKTARNGYWFQPVIKVSQTQDHSYILQMIHCQYGGHFNKRRVYKDNSKPTFTLDIKGEEKIRKLLDDILPYLIIKKPQAELILEYYNLGTVMKRNSEGIKKLDELQSKRSVLYKKARMLNKRGTAAETE